MSIGALLCSVHDHFVNGSLRICASVCFMRLPCVLRQARTWGAALLTWHHRLFGTGPHVRACTSSAHGKARAGTRIPATLVTRPNASSALTLLALVWDDTRPRMLNICLCHAVPLLTQPDNCCRPESHVAVTTCHGPPVRSYTASVYCRDANAQHALSTHQVRAGSVQGVVCNS